jgi:hypothetical protein
MMTFSNASLNRGQPFDVSQLKAYYKFDEASSTIANSASTVGSVDDIANAQLTLSGATHGATGLFNNGVNFDGTNDFVNAASSAVADWGFLNQTSEQWSLVLWLKFNSFGQDGMIMHTTNFNATDTGCFIKVNTTRTITATIGHEGVDDFNYTTTLTVDNDTTNYQMIVITYDDATGNLIFIHNDGTPETSGSHNLTNTNDPEQVFRMGDNSDAVFDLDAVVDEYSIWNRVLTAAEITSLYNSGTGLEITS